MELAALIASIQQMTVLAVAIIIGLGAFGTAIGFGFSVLLLSC